VSFPLPSGNPVNKFPYMSKSTIKFYLIPGIILITVIIIITVIAFIYPKPTSPTTNNPQPFDSAQGKPTHYNLPTITYPVQPTTLPIQDFTGADINQTLPPQLKNIGEQKTALRRLTPLTLAFATIEFDYENDVFLVRLLDPKEESKIQFTTWKDQNYPALTEGKFVFN